MMLRVLLCFFLVLVAARAEDAVVTVGGKAIRIPSPATGFVRYDGKNTKIDEIRASFIPKSNRVLAAYADPNDWAKVLDGKFPQLTRSFDVQENRQYENDPLTPESFAAVQASLREQMESMKSSASSPVAGPVKNVENTASTAMSKAINLPLKVRFGEVHATGDLVETPLSTCFWMVVNSRMLGKPLDDTSVDPIIGGCVMRVQDRLLYLYVNSNWASKTDEIWVKEKLVSWRDAVLAANPEAPKEEARETAALPPEPLSDPAEPVEEETPWWRSREWLPVVAGAGALMVAGFFLFRRRTPRSP